MDDLSETNTECCNNATVVLNGTVFSLAQSLDPSLATDVKAFDAEPPPQNPQVVPGVGDGAGPQTQHPQPGVRLVVDSNRRFVLSVSDQVVSLGNVSSTADLSGQLLVPTSGLIDSQSCSLFDNHGEVVSAQPVDTGCTPINIQLPTTTTAVPARNTDPAPKKKGGWPKGRKRKPDQISNAPKAPASGYVLYSIDRRQEIKQGCPKLQFAEITKIMGNEWSSMSQEAKQKFLDQAEEDKKRYIEELKVYQQSKAYQQFLKKKRQNGMGSEEEGTGLEIDAAALSDDLEDDGLYCRVCNMYFRSQHNRKEHFYGKQHLQNIVNDYEKELQQQLLQQEQNEALMNSDLSNDLLASGSEEGQPGCSRCSGPDDIEGFIQQFMEKNCERESEIRELQQSVEKNKEKNTQLVTKIEHLKQVQEKMEEDVEQMKAFGSALGTQIDALKMVPTLFGVINF